MADNNNNKREGEGGEREGEKIKELQINVRKKMAASK